MLHNEQHMKDSSCDIAITVDDAREDSNKAIVLAHTVMPPLPKTKELRPVWEACDGMATVADLIKHVHHDVQRYRRAPLKRGKCKYRDQLLAIFPKVNVLHRIASEVTS